MDDYTLAQIVEAVKKNINSPSSPGSTPVTYRKENITLAAAKVLADVIEEEAKRVGVKAVIAITNTGANPVLIHATDDSFIASYDVALQKAFTSVALKMPTSTLKGMAQPGSPLYGIQFTNNGRIVIFGGGDPLTVGDTIVGGLGVSGGSEELDTYLSDFGAKYFKENIAPKIN